MFSYLYDYYKSFPRPIRRMTLWYGLLLVAFFLTFIAVSALWPDVFKLFDAYLGRFSIVPFLSFQFLLIACHLVGLARLRGAFRAADGRLCTECAHSVAGLGEQGICPECGHWFNIEVDRIAWRASGIELKKPR